MVDSLLIQAFRLMRIFCYRDSLDFFNLSAEGILQFSSKH